MTHCTHLNKQTQWSVWNRWSSLQDEQLAVLMFLRVVVGLYRENTIVNILSGLEMTQHIVTFTVHNLSSGTSVDTLHSLEDGGAVEVLGCSSSIEAAVGGVIYFKSEPKKYITKVCIISY